MTPWDVIVIGAGIEGSATAYQLALMGRKTLQLEQFTLPHSRGSSHGHSRITRKAYPEEFYARMMLEAYQTWADLEKSVGKKLYTQAGCVHIDKIGSKEMSDVEKSLASINCRALCLDAAGLSKRYPAMQFDSSYAAVVDPDGGILAADKCLSSFQSEFRRLGGVLQDSEPVLRITPSSSLVTVQTTKDTYTANSVVIAAGSWTNKLIDPLGLHLPLRVQRVVVFYWKALQKGFEVADGFPTFIVPDGPDREMWGLPVFEYPGFVKIAYHGGHEIDSAQRDIYDTKDTQYLDYAVNFVRTHLKGLEPRPSIMETCIYSCTPDNNFILDRHPKFKNIIIGAGFSGHGFKLSPVVGKVLAELATFKKPSYCLDPFAISRFYTPDSKL